VVIDVELGPNEIARFWCGFCLKGRLGQKKKYSLWHSHTPARSRALSRTLAHSRTLSHSLAHTLGHSRALSRTLAHSWTLSRTLAHSRTLSHTLAHSRTLSHSLALSRTLSHSLALSRTLSHILVHSRTLAHIAFSKRTLNRSKQAAQFWCGTIPRGSERVLCASHLHFLILSPICSPRLRNTSQRTTRWHAIHHTTRYPTVNK
jgi:hypothetical protein